MDMHLFHRHLEGKPSEASPKGILGCPWGWHIFTDTQKASHIWGGVGGGVFMVEPGGLGGIFSADAKKASHRRGPLGISLHWNRLAATHTSDALTSNALISSAPEAQGSTGRFRVTSFPQTPKRRATRGGLWGFIGESFGKYIFHRRLEGEPQEGAPRDPWGNLCGTIKNQT